MPGTNEVTVQVRVDIRPGEEITAMYGEVQWRCHSDYLQSLAHDNDPDLCVTGVFWPWQPLLLRAMLHAKTGCTSKQAAPRTPPTGTSQASVTATLASTRALLWNSTVWLLQRL